MFTICLMYLQKQNPVKLQGSIFILCKCYISLPRNAVSKKTILIHSKIKLGDLFAHSSLLLHPPPLFSLICVCVCVCTCLILCHDVIALKVQRSRFFIFQLQTSWQTTTNWYNIDLLVLTEAMTPVKRIDVQLTTGEWTTIFVDALSASPVRAAGWRHQGYTRASGPGSRLTSLLQWGFPVKLYSQSQILMFPLPVWIRRPQGQTLKMYSCSTMW